MDPQVMDAQANDGVTSPAATPAAAPAAPAVAPSVDQSGQQQAATPPAVATPPAPAAQAPAAPAAPETYTFSLPEEVVLSEQALAAYADVAKELKLPQDQAQTILAKVAPSMLAHQAAEVAKVHAQWSEQSINDSEFGGENLEKNLGVAKRAVDAFGTPALNDLLNKTGLASNPEIIRLLYRAGKAISPDGFTPSSGSGPASRRDPAEVLFGAQS